MYPRRLIALGAVPAFWIACMAGCSTAPPPPAAPPPPVPVATAPPPKNQQASQADQDWNLFPDPTTGNVDVYYKGKYLGAVTGNEPASEDPPIPHPVDDR
jgi:hypothetical protein